jgi:2-dehydro-3-deoxyphosphogalactonate aldolase
MALDDVIAGGAPPVVAILRGVRPDEVVNIGAALVDAGIRLIEVPLNSPDPFASIAALQQAFGGEAVIGAGTVLDAKSVDRLAATGARLMVAPNTDAAVIKRALHHGLEPMPGCLTPSEAFAAIAAGAQRLKLFPAFTQGPAYVRALRDVLPTQIGVWAVGGVDVGNLAGWLAAGAEGVAVGGALFRPGASAGEVGEKARVFVAQMEQARSER